MCIEDLLGRIADVLAEGNEINLRRVALCEEILALQKEQRAKAPRSRASKSQKAEEPVKTDAPQELTEETKAEPEKTVDDQSFKTFESREELRAACNALILDPDNVTEAERAVTREVYSRYGRCLNEIPPEKWGLFYEDLKKAFDEVHANA